MKSVYGAVGLIAVGSAAALCLAGAAGSQPVAGAAAPGGACAALKAPGLFADTTVQDAHAVAADAGKGLPGYCELSAVISPVQGSAIGVVYRLPEGWNGKLLGLGGGGWAGNLRIESAAEGLKRGYATLQTDGGHPTTSVWDTAWAANPESITDFAYRAIHLMTVVGKQAAAKYYGRPQDKTYYQGCSTGGRQGLMEAQRFPDDYDGEITGAPVYNLLVQTSAVIRNQTFALIGSGVTADQLKLVNDAVLKACDGADGLEDGVIADPSRCAWDPSQVQCKPGELPGPGCLSLAQVEAVRRAYTGVKLSDGSVAAWPMARGGEVGWPVFMQISSSTRDSSNGGGFGGLRGPLLGDPNFDMSTFSAERDVPKVRASDFAKAYEANDPKLSAFTAHGGKLLMWHGWSDPGPSPVGTITYYNQVRASTPAAKTGVRLFMAPGVYHCGGGPGPDRIDLLTALDQWVTTGVPPATLIATKTSSKLSRPLCPYPQVALYKGAGDPDDAASFSCVAPKPSRK